MDFSFKLTTWGTCWNRKRERCEVRVEASGMECQRVVGLLPVFNIDLWILLPFWWPERVSASVLPDEVFEDMNWAEDQIISFVFRSCSNETTFANQKPILTKLNHFRWSFRNQDLMKTTSIPCCSVNCSVSQKGFCVCVSECSCVFGCVCCQMLLTFLFNLHWIIISPDCVCNFGWAVMIGWANCSFSVDVALMV